MQVKMPLLNSLPPWVTLHPFPFLTMYGYFTCFKLQLKESLCLKGMFVLYLGGKKSIKLYTPLYVVCPFLI